MVASVVAPVAAVSFEGWQVYALIFVPVLLAMSFALYYRRRRQELQREVAEHKRIGDELRRQKDLYEGMLTAQSELGEGLIIIEDQRIRYANRAFCEISGYSLTELEALPGLMELVAVEEKASILEHQRRRLRGLSVDTRFDTVLRRKNGGRVDIEVTLKALEAEDRRFKSIAVVRDITQRKRAEAKLREAEARYRTLVEQIPAVIYVQEISEPGSNRTSPTMYASPQIEAQSGYLPQAFVEDPALWIKLLHPADRERVLAEDERTDAIGEPFRMEYRQIARDGRVVWIRDDAILVRDEGGDPLYWLGIQHDITEQKRAEKALKESELRLRSVITNVPVVLDALDLAGVYTLSEGRGLDVLGFEPGEVVGRSISEVYGDRQEILDDVDRALAGEEFSAVREINSRTFETWYSPLRTNTGEVSGVIGVAIDVTERREAEERIKASEAELRALFEAMSDVILVLDSEGRYLEIAPTNPSLLYRPSGDLIGKTLHEVFPREQADEFLGCIRRALQSQHPVNIDYSLRIGGREVWFAGSVSPMLEDRVIFVARDVTERKRAEERLQEANRRLEELAALRADFTAMIAHEIGSPLAAVRGFLDVLATGELEPAARADALAKIRAEIDGLSTLVADMRSAAAIEHDDFTLLPRRTSVGELFENVARFAETLAGDHPLTVTVEAEEEVRVDPYRIGQVLRNLLSNAAKYSPVGAPIELRALPGGTPGRVRIEVTDRGRGVHPDDVDRIFEKFGRGRDRSGEKAYGAGLGLYVSRRIVQAHGGELTLDPAPGGGSVFSFELEAAG